MRVLTAEDFNKFWKFVKLVSWNPVDYTADDVRKALLRDISPNNADLYREICLKLAGDLYETFYTFYPDKAKLQAAATNAVGYGKENYSDALKLRGVMDALYEECNVINCFIVLFAEKASMK